jgi:hypothetical protein
MASNLTLRLGDFSQPPLDNLVIRPALFTDGECKAKWIARMDGKGKEKEPYRVKEGHISEHTHQ